MTTLDKAFIKAFGDTPSARHRAAPRAASADRPRTTILGQAGGARVHVDGGTALAPPRLETAQLAAADAAALGDRHAVAPLSTFASQPKPAESIRMAVEVERLCWPAVCHQLVAEAPRAWNAFADALTLRVGQGQRIVALASCQRGEGRTTLSLALAHHLATRGLRPLVVDADFDNPRIADSLGIDAYSGWGQVLENELPLGEALIAAIDERVTLMPWRKERQSSDSAADPASLTALCETFGTLAGRYDLVIVDTPPLASSAAIAAVAGFGQRIGLDAVYLVHDVRTTPRELVSATAFALARAGVAVAGLIENFVHGEASPG